MTEEAEAASESGDREDVTSRSGDWDSERGRWDGSSLQSLLPGDLSSFWTWLSRAEDGSVWTGVDGVGTARAVEKVSGFVSRTLKGVGGSGSGSGSGVVVTSVLRLQLKDCWMKLKLELKESSGEDRGPGLGLNPSSEDWDRRVEVLFGVEQGRLPEQ